MLAEIQKSSIYSNPSLSVFFFFLQSGDLLLFLDKMNCIHGFCCINFCYHGEALEKYHMSMFFCLPVTSS